MNPLPVAILAGGLATRLRPLTETIPKSLIEVNGEPFVAHQLRLLKAQRIERVVLCVGYLGEQVRDFVGEGSRFGLQVAYSEDGDQPLGTGGAIRNALPLLGRAFFVLYGDSYLTCNFSAVQQAFEEGGKPSLMTVYRNEGKYDKSNVDFRDGRVIAYDKQSSNIAMHHIDYGLGIFSAQIFRLYPTEGSLDLARVYQDALARNEVTGFEVQERFYEIGSFSGIGELSQLLAAQVR
jgi:N-acetyl-alpha-D-muramate 1-phosphate uridylyltransferase